MTIRPLRSKPKSTEADIRVVLTDESLSTTERVTVTYNLFNDGPSAAENVTFSASTTISTTQLTLNNSNYSCAIQSKPDGNAEIVCNSIGTLAPGGPYPVILDVSIGLNGYYFQLGRVDTTTYDPDSENNVSALGDITVN